MFLNQKFKYTVGLIRTKEQMSEVLNLFEEEKPKIMCFDTETTGLNFMSDTPFLLTFGWGKRVYGLDLTGEDITRLSSLYDMMKKVNWVFAHNAKYDYHMMVNYGRVPFPEEVRLADSQTIARLTNYADEDLNKGLDIMGEKYVDPTAKFASKVIKNKLSEINARRKKVAKQLFIAEFPDANFKDIWEFYEKKRVKQVRTDEDEYYNRLDELYIPANYYDVYQENPTLMLNYAYDDVVIMLEWLGKAIPVLKTTDPELKIFRQEANLIRPTARQERVGLLVDINYLLESRIRMVKWRDELYQELRDTMGVPTLTIGQHAVIKRMFARKYNITLESVDKKNLLRIKKEGEVQRLIFVINKLRTLDKWISTYIDGFMRRTYEGRIHTSIDLSGTVSGRVSSNMQQQPKEPFYHENGEVLFSPRQAIVADDDYLLVFFDYSQQELRVQAYYTLLCAEGDTNLCRAYMPFKCTSLLTDEEFDYKNPEILARWNSGEWLDENDNIWEPTDVHSITTHKAFPDIPYTSLSNNELNPPAFKKARKLGKVCNFLKNYQGGKSAIIDQLDVDEETADLLDKAYYLAFPVIRKYQQWVTQQMTKFGYVENLYGRRYHMQNSKWFYKAGNYLVQGSSADMIKQVELKVDALLKNTRSSFVMPVHDEIIVRIHKDETHLVPLIKEIMDDVPQVPWVPMLCEVEWTDTNWADKHLWTERE